MFIVYFASFVSTIFDFMIRKYTRNGLHLKTRIKIKDSNLVIDFKIILRKFTMCVSLVDELVQ